MTLEQAKDLQPLPISDPFSLETRFNAAFIARLALREKQVQQSYRPIISIHKWFARRPGSVFRGLMLSEFGVKPVEEEYWCRNDFRLKIADPFMGGGTTVFEALRLGNNVVASDINPMSYWLVRQAVEPINLDAFRAAGDAVWRGLKDDVGDLYQTECLQCRSAADVKYFFWAKTCDCPKCGETVTLLPSYRVAESVRHTHEVYHCPSCDSLKEIDPSADPRCPDCLIPLSTGSVRRGNAHCRACDHDFKYAPELAHPPAHRMYGLEYNCSKCYSQHPGRQFKTPDAEDHARFARAALQLIEIESSLNIPDDEIPEGDETTRLLRWGYTKYRELFNDRQLLGLGLLMARISKVEDRRLRGALATVFSDFLRYQNLLCRYDTYALKCQDIFAVHGYPVALQACENNLPGITGIGSGSFVHFIAKFAKAKRYAQAPYETRYEGKRKIVIPVPGESIEAPLRDLPDIDLGRSAALFCAPSQDLGLSPASLDGVFTDPPYYDNVQYAELMDFCFVWLRKILSDEPAFAAASTRTVHELTGNATLNRGLAEFSQGMSEVFTGMARAMKPGAPLVFTYHHNLLEAYGPLAVAILDAGLTCTSELPVPAEMAASIHISGTKSSILDTVFVCRDRDFVEAHITALPPHEDIGTKLNHDISSMEAADYACTSGDIACLRAGHIAGEAIRDLAPTWDPSLSIDTRLERARQAMASIDALTLALDRTLS